MRGHGYNIGPNQEDGLTFPWLRSDLMKSEIFNKIPEKTQNSEPMYQ